MLSPGVMHDVDSTFEHTPTTPRQIISSSPTTPRQRTDNAFEVVPWDTTNPLHGLHVVQVDDEHFFAQWRYKSDPPEFGWIKERVRHPLEDMPWLQNVRSERTDLLEPQREAVLFCRYFVHVWLYVNLPTALRGSIPSEDIDLTIYICHNTHTQTVSVRFMVECTQVRVKNLQNRAMGFELVTSGPFRTCKVAQWEPWRDLFNYMFLRVYGLLEWYSDLADESRLQPFIWPSDDDDVQRAQFFKLYFGADGKDMVPTGLRSWLQW